MKPKRVVDKKLLETCRHLPCIACMSDQILQDEYRRYVAEFGTELLPIAVSHPHHVVTRGAGGGDTVDNLISLCVKHHSEIHRIGNERFREKYYAVNNWFKLTGK